MRLLLVEDEEILCEALLYIFKKNNYEADAAHDGITGLKMAETGIYDVIILDWMLPEKSGVEIVAELRKKSIATPVLMLTAKHSVDDKIGGLDAGADDYMIKPFSNEELLARIRALGRRKNEIAPSDVITVGKCSFYPRKGELVCGGKIVSLTLKESNILELLSNNKNNVVVKDILISKIWGDEIVEQNNIEVFISYLRKKLSSIECGFVITTLRGIGYKIAEEVPKD